MSGVKGRSGSGGRRPGAGRPPSKISLRAGDEFHATWRTSEGLIDTTDFGLLRVVAVERHKIVLCLGDNVFTLRR